MRDARGDGRRNGEWFKRLLKHFALPSTADATFCLAQ